MMSLVRTVAVALAVMAMSNAAAAASTQMEMFQEMRAQQLLFVFVLHVS
jgi:hypothetical protein